MKKLALLVFLAIFLATSETSNIASVSISAGLIGGPCEASADCVGEPDTTSYCDSTTELCNCKDNYVAKSDLMDCLEIQNQVGQECLESQQCTSGSLGDFSYCVDSTCQCTENAVKDPLQPECLLKSNLVGDTCKASIQCQINLGHLAVCNDYKCECLNSVSNSNQTRCLSLASQIGEECLEDSQCTAGAPGTNSKCINFTCQCNEGYVNSDLGDTCLPEKHFKETCTDNTQCIATLGDLAICQKEDGAKDAICKCNEQIGVPNKSMTTCLPLVSNIGGECLEPQQCTKSPLGDLSNCLDNKCSCVDAAVKDPLIPKCLLKSNLVGEPCQSSLQCQVNLGYLSVCSSFKCECFSSVPNSKNNKCLPLATTVGEQCQESPQCTEGNPGEHSLCKNSTCRCNQDYVDSDIGDTCLPRKLLKEICTDKNQCTSTLGELAICRKKGDAAEGICQCDQSKGVPSRDLTTCLPLATYIGSSCQLDKQCQLGLPGPYSTCQYKLGCQCTDEAVRIPGSATCHKKANFVDEPCHYSTQCTANLGNLTECYLDLCKCIVGAVASSDGDKCLKGQIPIGHECEDKAQCVTNALCTGTGQCSCEEKHIPNENFDKCLPVQDFIGGPCEERTQCLHGAPGNLSDCIVQNFTGNPDKVCNCTEDAVARPRWETCYRKAQFVGDHCEFLEQCAVPLGFSRCSENACICSDLANPSADKTKCVLKAELGQPCTDDGQCSHIPQENSAGCLEKPGSTGEQECQCKAGYVINQDGTTCLKMAELIGQPCEYQMQCDGLDGANCLALNETGKACHCDYSLEVVSSQRNKCLPIVHSLNQDICEETVQCEGIHAECLMIQNLMQCRCNNVTYVESIHNPRKCIEVVNEIDRECQEDIQCSKGIGELAECRNFSCQCTYPNMPFNNRCHASVGLGRPCTADVECQLGANNLTICSPNENKCECQENALEHESKCWANKRVGDQCASDKECTVSILGEPICDLGKCACPSGKSAQFDYLLCANSPWWLSSPLLISFLLLMSLGMI